MPAHVLALSFLPGIFRHTPLLTILPGFYASRATRIMVRRASASQGAEGELLSDLDVVAGGLALPESLTYQGQLSTQKLQIVNIFTETVAYCTSNKYLILMNSLFLS